ncbi:ABC transporter substrate-binding protein [uncultured Parolsenella sp.]|uniref:ABC transporter substrate-binding protein n=1 Tax=uncultured Parolsenella sp. TaxID=2083008 RepID=UPI0025F01A5A|nr:ABC transporter substrate-binding protein [uncultured Parolsenella sp.]
MRTFTRRQFLLNSLLGAGALTAGLTGCGNVSAPTAANNGSASQASSDGTIELKYWYCWTDKIKENNEERVKEFNDSVGKDKGIHVTAEYQGSYDDLNAKLKTAFTANEEPDVSVMVINSTQAFADGGMIQKVDDLIDASDVSDFWPGLMDNCKVNGDLYGVPYLRSTPVLYYNKSLFEKAGLDSNTVPATWDDMVRASDALKSVGVGGFGFYSYIWMLTALNYCNGGAPFGDDLSAKTCTFNEAPAVEMAKWLKDGVDNHNFAFAGGSNGSDTLKTNAANQKVAMWVSSTADLTNYLDLANQGGYEIGVGFIPKNVQNKVPTGGCNLVMTSRLQDDRRSAAGEFINFMTSRDAAVKNHLKTGYLLTRQSDKDDDRIKEAYAKTPEYQVAFDQMQYAIGDYMNAGYAEASKDYTDAIEKAMGSSADQIQSILDDAKAKADPVLAGN